MRLEGGGLYNGKIGFIINYRRPRIGRAMGFGLVLVAGLQLARVTHKCADLLIVIVENCTCSNSFVPESLYRVLNNGQK